MSYPRLSISECTTWSAPIEEDVAAYAGAGVEGIGIWEFKLSDGRDDQAIDLIERSGLVPTLCVPEVPSIIPDPFFAEPKDPTARKASLIEAIRRLARFHPVAVMVLSGSLEGVDHVWMRKKVVDGVRDVAQVAADLGITLGFEPLRQSAGSLTTSLPDTADLIDGISAPNIKIIADTWHFWDVPNAMEHLTQHAKKIVGVQISDWRDPPRSWCGRRLPGDGQIDFRAIYSALERGGFNGWYDVEIFSDNGQFGDDFADSLWKVPARELAKRAVQSFRKT